MDPEKITYFAEADARNSRVEFGIKAKDRTKHIYVIGKTGMGKSTLLENMAIQDIQGGEGMAFVDPHGKTADLLLDYVPEERIKDVVYFAPFDTDYPISFNVMEDVGIDKRHLVANGLMSAFKKIWVDAWSARMEYILNNTLLALLEYPDSTLVGVNRMLSDKAYRKKVVENISDPSVKSFWVDEFEKYGERYMQEAGAAIQNKVGQFIANPLVRNIIGQPKSTFDFRQIMDEKKIVIINLSKGRVGEQNANLLGSMLITKIYLAAMSRADVTDSILKTLPNFYLYVDEFQSFANESFADILSEARKYKLNLTIAHQYIEQMSEEVRAAVFGNVGTMIAFRVGAFDAEVLEKEFAPTFTAEDLVNLGFVQIYLKLMIDGVSSQPFSARTAPPIEKPEHSYRTEIIESSRALFSRPRASVEEAIRIWHEPSAQGGSSGSSQSAERRDKPASAPNNKGNFADMRKAKKEIEKEKKAIFEQIIEKEQIEEQEKSPERGPEKRNESERIESVERVSLKTLEQSAPRKDKGPSATHVSELRQVLAELVKKDTNVKKDISSQQQMPSRPVQPQTPSPKSELESHSAEGKNLTKDKKEKTPNEIPEDELRKLLHVDREA